MVIDGKAIAARIKAELLARLSRRAIAHPAARTLSLAIISLTDDPVIERFIRVKKRLAEELGIAVEIIREPTLPASADGVIVQLPLPKEIDAEKFLAKIPPAQDVDALGSHPLVLSPVTAAVREILETEQVGVKDRAVAVVGKGKLVGAPVAAWLRSQGARVSAFGHGDDLSRLARFDVIVSGVGAPHLIKPEMLKEETVLIDAGTSEATSKLAGDADPSCAAKCRVFTPVPGGIGPIAVVLIFKNLLDLAEKKV